MFRTRWRGVVVAAYRWPHYASGIAPAVVWGPGARAVATKDGGSATTAAAARAWALLTRLRDESAQLTRQFFIGSKLLWKNWRLCQTIRRDIRCGKQLTWRDHQHVVYTREDLQHFLPFIFLQLLPFSVFFILGALAVCPNILPRVYATPTIKDQIFQRRRAKSRAAARRLMAHLRAKMQGGGAPAQGLPEIVAKIVKGRDASASELLAHAECLDRALDLDSWDKDALYLACQVFGLCSVRFLPAAGLRRILHAHIRKMGPIEEQLVAPTAAVDTISAEELRDLCACGGVFTMSSDERVLRALLNDMVSLRRLGAAIRVLHASINTLAQPSHRPGSGQCPSSSASDAAGGK